MPYWAMVLVTVVHVVACLSLILIVLFQGGENVDITAAFGGVSQAAFGPRGAVTFMQKLTWALGAIFMATSITLAIYATKSGSGSILETAPAKTAPQTPAPAPPTPPVTPPVTPSAPK